MEHGVNQFSHLNVISLVTLVFIMLLFSRCHSLHASHLDWLSSDPDSAKFIVEFNAHLLYHLDVFGCHKVETLVDILFDMFNTLFTVGCGNPENLKTATDMLKVSF